MRASRRAVYPRGRREVDGGRRPRPTASFAREWFASERAWWDPKDGELCLSRAKPEETLVEARRCADVQIAFRTWA